MSSPCWRHHLEVFSREGWAYDVVSMSMLMVQSTYAGSRLGSVSMVKDDISNDLIW
jgi:hypothetical protein